MATKIFQVTYSYQEYLNGKRSSSTGDSKKVVATDALDAINKAKKIIEKPFSFKDSETKKTLTATAKNIKFKSVTLIAESGLTNPLYQTTNNNENLQSVKF